MGTTSDAGVSLEHFQSVTTHFYNCKIDNLSESSVLTELLDTGAGSHDKMADLSGNFHVLSTAKHQFVVKTWLFRTSAGLEIGFLIVARLCRNQHLGF